MRYKSKYYVSKCPVRHYGIHDMLFDTLMVKAKKDGDQTTTSITDFFMNNSTCAKSENGYYTWKCVTQKCKDCKNCSSMLLSCKRRC